jgi:hypothetical protein
LSCPDGSKYVGKYVNDQRNGWGTYTDASGKEAVGMWKEDRLVKWIRGHAKVQATRERAARPQLPMH